MEKTIKRLVVSAAIFIVALFVLVGAIEKVGAGERGVVLNWGAVSDKVLDEGISTVVPFKQKVIKLDVTTQIEEVQASAASQDLQLVTTSIALNYHLDPSNVNKLYQEMRKEYRTRVIAPSIQESIKAVTAKYTAEDLVRERENVRENIKTLLEEKLNGRYIVIEAVNITNFNFSAEFDSAIEAKQTAVQKALEAQNNLERIKFEAQQRVEQAKAEAEAIRIQAQAITQQGGREYVNLKWVEAWREGGSQVPQTILGDGAAFLYNLGK